MTVPNRQEYLFTGCLISFRASEGGDRTRAYTRGILIDETELPGSKPNTLNCCRNGLCQSQLTTPRYRPSRSIQLLDSTTNQPGPVHFAARHQARKACLTPFFHYSNCRVSGVLCRSVIHTIEIVNGICREYPANIACFSWIPCFSCGLTSRKTPLRQSEKSTRFS